MNHIVLIGNLCADPELRTTVSGKSVCNFRIAVSRRFSGNQQDGDQQDADYFAVVAWNSTAENCAKYLAKGRKVCVVGSITQRKFEGRDGTQKSRMEVNATEVEFITTPTAAAAPPAPPSAALPNGSIYADPGDEGELPF